MNFILSIFTFKKNFEAIFNNEQIKNFFEKAKELIIQVKAYKELSGEEKKARVDSYLEDYIIDNFETDNAILEWLIDRVIEFLPTITQIIYDFLKEKIKEL